MHEEHLAASIRLVHVKVALDAVSSGRRGGDVELGAEVEATQVIVQILGDSVGGVDRGDAARCGNRKAAGA